LDGNARRDRRTDAALVELGWTVLRFWEHDEPEQVADVICSTLARLRAGGA
jgi:DNA mismatch endonuclease (patch repair protein)